MIDLDVIQKRNEGWRRSFGPPPRSLEDVIVGFPGPDDVDDLIAEVKRLRADMTSDHWFRINAPDGSLWMETSNEEEATNESAKTGWPLERLFSSKQSEWRRVGHG